MERVSIIIPAYNEERRIAGTLEEYSRFFTNLKKTKKLDSEILIVINNTKDKTEDIVKKCKKKYKIIKYLNFKQGGKGFAIIEGFREALKNNKNSIIGFVDADLATGPEAFYDLVKSINGFDGAIGSRYIPGAKVNPKQTLQRIIVSRVYNFFLRVLFLINYKDTQCGVKIFKKATIEKIIKDLTITQWAFDTDILYQCKKNNFHIKEHPTSWSDKEYSKIDLGKSGSRMVLASLRLRIINSPFKKTYNLLKPIGGFVWRILK